MGESSKEAQAEATALMDQLRASRDWLTDGDGAVAAALQRHMDLHEHAKAAWDRSVALSAAFEARVKELEAERDAWKRAADAVASAYSEHAHAALKCAQVLEAKLDELIGEVRDWIPEALIELPSDAIDLERILAKYAGRKP